jgi:hypothetical protein
VNIIGLNRTDVVGSLSHLQNEIKDTTKAVVIIVMDENHEINIRGFGECMDSDMALFALYLQQMALEGEDSDD